MPPPFAKLLIANRGEIACRIAATARRLGVRSVAIYTAADAQARHTRLTDEAVQVPSYLDADAILTAAAQSGAQALHPGCGFLSESAAFAAQCRAAGIVFVGPSTVAMESAASKAAARQLAARTGVPIVPGFDDAGADDATLQQAAEQIGTPLLIKAVAGGGGRGLRVVEDLSTLAPALASARREAAGGFGDDNLLLEKYIPRARHVEVQLLADAHGTVHTLGVRDCSLQRRHQKVVEETPAPNLPDGIEDALCTAARQLAAAMNYSNAGTVEFLLDAASAQWYFLEINARLQVEHPVTEAVYGTDLVEWQLRIAAGEALPATAWAAHGAAMEARICAEQPLRGFLPSSGRLHKVRLPATTLARVDTGVEEGDAIAEQYDSLLLKIITHADTREGTRQQLAQALAQLQLSCESNTAFVQYLLHSPAFINAEMYTALIEEDTPHWQAALRTQRARTLALAAAALLFDRRTHGGMAGFRLNTAATTHWAFCIGEDAYRAQVQCTGEADAEVRLQQNEEDAQTLSVQRVHLRHENNETQVQGAVDGQQMHLCRTQTADTTYLHADGMALTLLPPPVHTAARARAADATAPMNAVVSAVAVQVGQVVEEGAPLLMLEAMKMELHITAPHAGVVAHIHCAPGARVAAGALLVEITPQADADREQHNEQED